MQHLTYDLRTRATALDVNGFVTISHEELDILLDRIDRAHHDEVELYSNLRPWGNDPEAEDSIFVKGYDKGLEDAKNHALTTMTFLPLDIDGEPIRVGDVMEYGIVMEMAIGNDGSWYITLDGDGIWDGTWEPRDLRHLNIDNPTDILEAYHRIMSQPGRENNPQSLLDSITGHFVKLLDNCKKENDDE